MIDRVSVIGLGKLGASMMGAFAKQGFDVIGVDVDIDKVEAVNQGHAPVQETNLESVISNHRKNIEATTDTQCAVLNSDISFVIVPTPSDDKGSFLLEYVEQAFRQIGRGVSEKDSYHLIVLTSTVLPGSTRQRLWPLLEKKSGKICGKDFGLCYSPEFIALGSIINDFLNPDFTLIGEFDEKSGNMLKGFYKQVMKNNPPCKRMEIENAELTKIALNSYITTKISFANMLSEICENVPYGNVDVVTDAIGEDDRIGHKYLKGGASYGGPCFPRDNEAFSFIAGQLDAKAKIAETVGGFNTNFVERTYDKIKRLINNDSTVAILGLSYKPKSHIITQSEGMFLLSLMYLDNFDVIGYDPLANQEARRKSDEMKICDSLQECLNKADTFIITTPDNQFKNLTVDDFDLPVSIIDIWRILDNKMSNEDKVKYIPIGRNRDRVESLRKMRNIWKS